MSEVIDTSNFNEWVRMEEEKFQDVAKEENNRKYPQVHIVEIPNQGYAILGTYGVYESKSKTRIFANLQEVHEVLKDLGIKKFTEVGQLKEFA